jgi:hypothetical protein
MLIKIENLFSKTFLRSRSFSSASQAQKKITSLFPLPLNNKQANPLSLKLRATQILNTDKKEEDELPESYSGWYTPKEGTKAYDAWEKRIKQNAAELLEQNKGMKKNHSTNIKPKH